mgnify:FL=1
MPKQKEEPSFEVWEDNWEVVMMFIRLQTQWNTTMGGFIGIKYEVLEWLCRLYSVKDHVAMLEGIQIMEASALKLLNEKE